MSVANGNERQLATLLGYFLKEYPLILNVFLHLSYQEYEIEDQGIEQMATKIRDTENELSHASDR